MKAAVVHRLGEAPKYGEFEDPAAGEGEALVKVRAAGLHPVVRAIASGKHYSAEGKVPAVAGLDGVGTLEDGTRVYFGGVRKPWGTMAELAAAPRGMTFRLPDGIDDTVAAALANPGMSAWMSLKERGEVAAGERVVILGATGVAGQMAIQCARLLGAGRVVGVGRNVDALAGADVDAVIGLNEPEEAVREAFAREAAAGIDVVIDYLWGRPTELLLEALAQQFNPKATHRTRLVEVGSSAGATITLPGATLRSVDLTLLGSGFGSARLDRIFAAIGDLFEMAAQGRLKIGVEAVPLADVESAWNRAETGRRVVFVV
ncbi:MAG TPA: zinc-binding alcohol dehydrogenase family protein [Terracidiphilus sp.]|nr:zinc-binding alcohol dehydrogenase family protein [Terracidiphilus sp.]